MRAAAPQRQDCGLRPWCPCALAGEGGRGAPTSRPSVPAAPRGLFDGSPPRLAGLEPPLPAARLGRRAASCAFRWAGSRALQDGRTPTLSGQLEALSRLVALEMGAPRADQCSAKPRWEAWSVEPRLREASLLAQS